MKKHVNLVLNVVLYLCFCGLVGTGLVLEVRLCENPHLIVLGLAAEDWRDLHAGVSYSFLAVVLLHLLLHWAWIRALAKKHFWATVVGAAAGASVVGALLLTPGQTRENSHQGFGQGVTHEADDCD